MPKISKKQELALKRELIAELERKKNLTENLPHLYAYGGKWYKWAWEFFNSTAHLNFLCAGNQLSKSSTLIRTNIERACNQALWPQLWKRPPRAFIYLYPTQELATTEFEDEWENNWLPKGELRDAGPYSWRPKYSQRIIKYVEFVISKVRIYFYSYKQDPKDIQAKTIEMVTADEECPYKHFHELLFRLSATNGYYYNGFTATIGQEYLRKIVEPRGDEEQIYPDALIRSVSAYDCMKYMDGTPSHWTEEKINGLIKKCVSPQEVDKRVLGRFVVDGGLKYPSFIAKKNVTAWHPTPSSWFTYVGVDIGSGGENNHPSAIAIVRVNPDFSQGRVVETWRGDGLQTTAGDVIKQLMQMLINYQPVTEIRYDWASKDFGILAERSKLIVLPAIKDQNSGQDILNSAFKSGALLIYEGPQSGDNAKLVTELSYLKKSTLKRNAKDDLIDALRYAAASIPWRLDITEALDNLHAEANKNPTRRMIKIGRQMYYEGELDSIIDEFEEYNQLVYDYGQQESQDPHLIL